MGCVQGGETTKTAQHEPIRKWEEDIGQFDAFIEKSWRIVDVTKHCSSDNTFTYSCEESDRSYGNKFIWIDNYKMVLIENITQETTFNKVKLAPLHQNTIPIRTLKSQYKK